MPHDIERLPQQLSEDLERRLDEFDAAWCDGRQPAVADYLPDSVPDEHLPRRAQCRRYVAEVLSVDLEHRLSDKNAPEPARIEDYFSQVPWVVADPAILLELVDTEYIHRRNLGESVSLAEYQQRFPRLRRALRERLERVEEDLQRESGTVPGEPVAGNTDDTEELDPSVSETILSGTSEKLSAAKPESRERCDSFGNYELREEIARGGMGVVYKAWQSSARRFAAVKVILAGQFADAEEVRRFQTEAEAAANLDHPNIVPVYEVGKEGSHHFYSMAYIEGPTLAQVVSDHPLEPARAARILRDVAGAIEYAHGRGVIHRDLKPANVMLDGGETPRVTDFGLARQTGVESGVTAAGQLLGSPPYMPPEQAEGRIEQIDARSDVYSMGATLYCLLTGRPPFHAANHYQTIVQVIKEEPVSPRRLNETIPRDLENICLKALSKAPAERYQSAAALQADLDRFLTGVPTHARPIPLWERGYRFCRRRPAVATLLGASIGSVLVALVAVTFAWISTRKLLSEKTQLLAENTQLLAENASALQSEAAARQQAESAQQEAEDNLRHAEQATYRNALRHAPTLWARGDSVGMRNYLSALRERLSGWDRLRGWEYEYLQGLLDTEFTPVDAHDHDICAVTWSPDGRRVATASIAGQIKIWDWDDGKLTRHDKGLAGHDALVWSLRFVGNSDRLLSIADDGTARLWSREAAWTSEVVASDLSGIQLAAIAPGGQVWAWSDGTHVTVRTTSKSEPNVVWRHLDSQVSAIALDSTASRVAFADRNQHTVTIASTKGEHSRITLANRDDNTDCWALAFSQDGGLLASGHSDGALHIWNAQSGEWQWTRSEHDKAIYRVGFGHHPDQLLTCSDDRTVRLWSLSERKVLEVFRGHEDSVFDLATQPGGKQIATVGRDRMIRLFRPGRDHLHLAGLGDTDLAVPTSDGRGIWYVTDQSLRRVNFSSQAADADCPSPGFDVDEIHRLPGHGNRYVLAGRSELAIFAEAEASIVATEDSDDQAAADLRAVSCSASGKLVATGNADGGVRVWDLTTDEITWRRDGQSGVSELEFLGAGNSLLVVDIFGDSGLFDLPSEEPRLRIQLPDQTLVVRASPVESVIAVGERGSGTIRLIDVQDQEELVRLGGSKHDVNDVCWSPDGRRLASANSDHRVSIWATDYRDNPQQPASALYQLEGHLQPVRRVFWSDDGSTLISLDEGGHVIRWRTTRTPD